MTGSRAVFAVVLLSSLVAAGCAMDTGEVGASKPALLITTDGPTTADTPVGLAIEVDEGVGVPLRVRAGQKFFLDQVDLRAVAEASTDDRMLTALRTTSDFAGLDWHGLRFVEREPLLTPNPDGTFTDRRFFRNARWMEHASLLAVWQVDSSGHLRGTPLIVSVGGDDARRRTDGFFIRRLRAIQWATNCASTTDCSAATRFQEEALVEIRHSNHPSNTFRMHPDTTALRVWWTARLGAPWEIPVEQVADPEFDYGLRVELEAETPTGSHGYYEPGDDITFRFTLTDGAGTRLHPYGSMPSYADVVFGADQSGIRYYSGFFDSTTTYWRRKHREWNMTAEIIGPNQDVQPLRRVLPLEAFLGPDDTQVVGEPSIDGVYSEVTIIPPANVVFGGAFDPTHAAWFAPARDTITFHIPPDAAPGTYKVTVKAHRFYLGQNVPRSTTIEIQVGTSTHTEPQLTTGPCNTCHSGGGDLGIVLHANADRATCAGCHVPLAIELEGPVAVRTHYIHSRSDRFDAPLSECSNCHLSEESIQRTSQAACLSCHTSYPDSHVEAFGPIQSVYVGGGTDSFVQCTGACHVSHPNAGFGDDAGPRWEH